MNSENQAKGDVGEAFVWSMLTLKESFAEIYKVDEGADFLIIRARPCD